MQARDFSQIDSPLASPCMKPLPAADTPCQQQGFVNKKRRPKAALGYRAVSAAQAGAGQCTPCIFFFIQGVSSISTRPAPIGMAVKIRKKVDSE